jgi:hypothetical protein
MEQRIEELEKQVAELKFVVKEMAQIFDSIVENVRINQSNFNDLVKNTTEGLSTHTEMFKSMTDTVRNLTDNVNSHTDTLETVMNTVQALCNIVLKK